METMAFTNSFEYSVDNSGQVLTILTLKGEYRRGLGELPAIMNLPEELESLEKSAAKKVLVVDLTALSYWDTLGINEIVPRIKRINQKYGARAGIVRSKDDVVFEAAKLKFDEVDSILIPWAESKDDLLEKIQG
jgi:hypothetical protein